MNTQTATLIVRNIPKELKDRFKADCALRGETMNQAIIRLIEKEVTNGMR